MDDLVVTVKHLLDELNVAMTCAAGATIFSKWSLDRVLQKPMLRLLSFLIHHPTQILIPMKRHPLFQYFFKGASKIAKQMLKENGIVTVRDLHGLHFDQRLIVEIARRTKGLPVASIMWFLENIKNLSHEDAPPIFYYCDEENTYAAKFRPEENEWGELAWIHEIKKLQSFAKTVCIIDLVKHIVMREAKDVEGSM